MRFRECLTVCFVGVLMVASGAEFAVSGERMPAIVAGRDLRPYVVKAAEDVADDLAKIFGRRPEIVKGTDGERRSDAIVLRREGGGFETYSLASKEGNVLEISGGDDRGVMFGLYCFARDFLKVDPLWWFARRSDGSSPSHVPRKEMKWASISIRSGEPSFRYRGWFVNDEDFLNGFMPEENGTRAIDYPRYHVCFGKTIADRLYEAAARSGFNTMVCASYVDILNPDERRLVDLASARGLYITMHHQEPVGAGGLQMDVHFPEMRGTTYASHPELWRRAWRAYVTEWAKYPDVIFMLGLRGRRDLPFWTRAGNWDDARKVADLAETKRRAGLISQAMADQYAMVKELTGREKPLVATQLWMEGADFYHRGLLDIPKGTIVVFSDNCPGLKFQSDIGAVDHLPSGYDYGLYYHLAIVHGNHRCELVPPKRTRQILSDAHGKGAREFLLVNVSNVRPFRYTISAIGEMGRDLARFDADRFGLDWCAKRFGEHGGRMKRAYDLHFAAYETVPSRDTSSSYGAPRARAELPFLNDGIAYSCFHHLLHCSEGPAYGNSDRHQDPMLPYDRDPDEASKVPADQWSRTNQDMFPYFANRTRIGPRAAAQAAGFERALDALEAAEEGMSPAEREDAFFALGYQAGTMCRVSRLVSELALRMDAKHGGNAAAMKRHLSAAQAASAALDALAARYASGVWKHWFDRDLIYPYGRFTEQIRGVK